MIRFICRHNWKDSISGAESHSLFTIDAEIPEIESVLTKGGFGENGYEFNECIGVEVVIQKEKGQG